MKKETIIVGIILPIILFVLSALSSLFTSEIRQYIATFISVSDIFLVWLSIVFLLCSFALFIMYYTKRKMSDERNYFNEEFKRFYDHFDKDDTDIRTGYRREIKCLRDEVIESLKN